jgi:hypothetical protein
VPTRLALPLKFGISNVKYRAQRPARAARAGADGAGTISRRNASSASTYGPIAFPDSVTSRSSLSIVSFSRNSHYLKFRRPQKGSARGPGWGPDNSAFQSRKLLFS